MLAVWSRPDVIHSNAAMQAKLGGTGLGLVALLSADKMGVETAPLETLQALGNFLVYMQNPDGSFVSKYVRRKVVNIWVGSRCIILVRQHLGSGDAVSKRWR